MKAPRGASTTTNTGESLASFKAQVGLQSQSEVDRFYFVFPKGAIWENVLNVSPHCILWFAVSFT